MIRSVGIGVRVGNGVGVDEETATVMLFEVGGAKADFTGVGVGNSATRDVVAVVSVQATKRIPSIKVKKYGFSLSKLSISTTLPLGYNFLFQ